MNRDIVACKFCEKTYPRWFRRKSDGKIRDGASLMESHVKFDHNKDYRKIQNTLYDEFDRPRYNIRTGNVSAKHILDNVWDGKLVQ